MTDLMPQHAGQLPLGLQPAVERRRNKTLAAREGKGVDGLGISQQMKIEAPLGILRGAALHQAHADLVDILLRPLIGMQSAMLLHHRRCRLQTEGNFLMGSQADILIFPGNRVVFLRIAIGDQGKNHYSQRHQQAQFSIAAAAQTGGAVADRAS